jgi:hypothetical protein
MSSIIQRKAKRAAEAKFEKYVNCETSGFKELVEAAWAEAKPAFEDHEDPAGRGVFDFYVSAKDHPEVTGGHVLDVLRTMDDFKDDMKHVQVYQQTRSDETKFEISLVYSNVRDKQYEALIDAHRAKKQRTEQPVLKEEDEDEVDRELETEREMMQKEFDEGGCEPESELVPVPEEQAEEAQADGTLSGYPDDGTTPENGTFEGLLKAGTLQLKLVDRPGYAPDQAIEPGPKGRKTDVFEHKELFKKCYPRFFFNGEAKEWRRTAPAGWTGQPPAAA